MIRFITYLEKPHEGKVSLLPVEGEMAISRQEDVSRNNHSEVHVDGYDFARSGHVVDEDHKLHPAFPLVSLISMQDLKTHDDFSQPRRNLDFMVSCDMNTDLRELALRSEEDAQGKQVTKGQPKVEVCEVLVVLHEHGSPVADEHIEHD